MTKSRINIIVEPGYMADQSQPDQGKFAFSYHITIENRGDEPAQLIRRHWIIIDGNEKRQEVKGLGVVGEQPHLEPGESYSYRSGVVLQTPVGTMQGSYQFITDDGETFDTEIKPFLLAAPGIIH